MKQDIAGHDDVKTLVDTFYNRIQDDDLIGPVFNTIVKDWSRHLPKMYDFWSTALFYEPGYSGNAIAKHIAVDQQIPLLESFYERWKSLWFDTIDTLFDGEGTNAQAAKKRAMLMLELIHFKVDASRKPGFIQ